MSHEWEVFVYVWEKSSLQECQGHILPARGYRPKHTPPTTLGTSPPCQTRTRPLLCECVASEHVILCVLCCMRKCSSICRVRVCCCVGWTETWRCRPKVTVQQYVSTESRSLSTYTCTHLRSLTYYICTDVRSLPSYTCTDLRSLPRYVCTDLRPLFSKFGTIGLYMHWIRGSVGPRSLSLYVHTYTHVYVLGTNLRETRR